MAKTTAKTYKELLETKGTYAVKGSHLLRQARFSARMLQLESELESLRNEVAQDLTDFNACIDTVNNNNVYSQANSESSQKNTIL